MNAKKNEQGIIQAFAVYFRSTFLEIRGLVHVGLQIPLRIGMANAQM
jgi:hypothetical protein